MSKPAIAFLLGVSVSLQAALYFDAQHSTYAVAGQTETVAVADFNADGSPDIVTAHPTAASPSLTLFTNNGAGVFSTAASGPMPPCSKLIARDINGDGDPDLVALSQNSFLTLTNHHGTFSLAAATSTGGFFVWKHGIALTDLDADGWDEVTTVNGSSLMIYTNDHRGAFTHKQTLFLGGFYPTALAAGNFDDRSGIDLVVTHYEDMAMLVTNNGAGQLVLGPRLSSVAGPLVPRAADMNNDGLLDCTFNQALYTNSGAGMLVLANTNVAAGSAVLAIADLDADGWPEVISGNIRTNNHANVFSTAVPSAMGSDWDVVAADVNNDGALDLVSATTWGNAVAVLLQHPRHSLSIRRSAGQATVSWQLTSPIRTVESAPAVTGPWLERSATTNTAAQRLEISTPASAPAEYFRFR